MNPFAGARRKIAPFQLPEHPGDTDEDALAEYSAAKAASLNQHVIGYGDLAEKEWAQLGLEEPDLPRMRHYRLDRVRARLRNLDVAGILLYDPVNIRYALDSTNMQVWCTHNPVRYVWIPTDGRIILWDFHNCEHLSYHLELIDEIRHGQSWFYFGNGPRVPEMAARWAAELTDVIRGRSGAGEGRSRIAVDQLNPEGVQALYSCGVDTIDGEETMELARSIKSADEVRAMRRSIGACEAAVRVMRESLRPGLTENDLWAILHAENIRRGGEWIETRLLSSGPRTNPWFQESSARTIESGDMVAFDTDLVGPYGYCCDMSRTWLVGPGPATSEQRALFAMAREQIAGNISILKPGLSFRELSNESHQLTSDCSPNRYSMLYHGIGLCDEYPSIPYPQDWEGSGYDGQLTAGMTLCVESYVGRLGGHEGVKLEEQVLITETGCEVLTSYPFEPLLDR